MTSTNIHSNYLTVIHGNTVFYLYRFTTVAWTYSHTQLVLLIYYMHFIKAWGPLSHVPFSLKVTYPGHKTVHQAVRVPYGPAAFSALECNFCLQKSDYGSAFVPPPPSCSTPALEHSESGSDTLLPGVFTMLTLLLLQRLLDWGST